MFRHLCFVAAAATLVLATGNAAAVCPIFGFYRSVGDNNPLSPTYDSKCTDGDIQSAINNASATCHTNIVITHENPTYASQALEIYNKSISLEGVATGTSCSYQPVACNPSVGCGGGGAPPTPSITLSGNDSTSVIYIHGNSSVTLQSIELTGGGGNNGGGINFSGVGSLTLVDSSIVFNTAVYGGAIALSGSGGNATLTLGVGTIIEENTAVVDGGGIYLGAASHLLALAPYTFIGFNHAPNGNGGGIALAGPVPTQADIGSPGYNGSAVIAYNDAAYGGGISLVAQGPKNLTNFVSARLFGTDPQNPAAISNNSASVGGGGIYVQPAWDPVAAATIYAAFCATNFHIDNNVAPEGSAIYAESSYDGMTLIGGGTAKFNVSNECIDTFGIKLASLGATNCAPGVSCNTVNGNANLDSGSQPTPGAAIFMNPAATLDANRFVMRFNQGAHAIRLVGTYSAPLVDCLLANNTLSAELLRAENNGLFAMDACTLTRNTLGGPSVIYSTNKDYPDAHSYLQNSIVDQPGLVTVAYGDKSALSIGYVLSNDISTLPGATLGEPTFVDAAGGDYHLTLASLGIDFAPAQSYATITPPFDLDGVPRTFDIPTVPNIHGPRDLGAYERVPACYLADTTFCDGFDGVY